MFFLAIIRHESKTPIKDKIVSKFNRPNDHIPRKVLTPIVKNFELGTILDFGIQHHHPVIVTNPERMSLILKSLRKCSLSNVSIPQKRKDPSVRR